MKWLGPITLVVLINLLSLFSSCHPRKSTRAVAYDAPRATATHAAVARTRT